MCTRSIFGFVCSCVSRKESSDDESNSQHADSIAQEEKSENTVTPSPLVSEDVVKAPPKHQEPVEVMGVKKESDAITKIIKVPSDAVEPITGETIPCDDNSTPVAQVVGTCVESSTVVDDDSEGGCVSKRAEEAVNVWSSYEGMDAFSGRNSFTMNVKREGLEACKRECEKRNFGGFTVWGNTAYFRPHDADECRSNLKKVRGATMHLIDYVHH